MPIFITLEQALDQVGNDGQYQVKIFLVMGLQFVALIFVLLSPTYLYVQPPLICSLNDEIVQNYTCQNDESCDLYKITFDPSYQHTTFVNEFDLICNRDYLIPIAQSSMFLGSLIGCLVFCYFGRRIALLLAWGTTTFGIVAVCFTFNMIWFIFFNFIAGLGTNGAYNLCFVVLNETSGNLFRQKASMGLMIFWGAGEIACAFFYYLINNWRYVWICFAALPATTAFILSFQIYETPKYYLSQQQYEKAYDALDQIAKVNKKPKFDRTQILISQLDYTNNANTQKLNLQSQRKSNSMDSQPIKIQKYNFLSLFIYKSLRDDTIGFMGFLFAIQLIYFGGQFSLSNISNSGNAVYFLGGCLGVSELSSYLFIECIVEKLKRKSTIIISQTTCIILMAGFLFFGINYDSIDIETDCDFCQKEIMILVLSCLIRIFVAVSFALQPLYCAESYPTIIRTIGTGFVFSIGLMGSFLSPYCFYLAQKMELNPFVIIILLSLMGPIMSTILRETHGLNLKEQIDEVLKETIDQYD